MYLVNEPIDFFSCQLDRPVEEGHVFQPYFVQHPLRSERFILHYPLGQPLHESTVTNVDPQRDNTLFRYEADTPTRKGSSGAPIYYLDNGALFGINFAGDDVKYSFGVPIDNVVKLQSKQQVANVETQNKMRLLSTRDAK